MENLCTAISVRRLVLVLFFYRGKTDFNSLRFCFGIHMFPCLDHVVSLSLCSLNALASLFYQAWISMLYKWLIIKRLSPILPHLLRLNDDDVWTQEYTSFQFIYFISNLNFIIIIIIIIGWYTIMRYHFVLVYTIVGV